MNEIMSFLLSDQLLLTYCGHRDQDLYVEMYKLTALSNVLKY